MQRTGLAAEQVPIAYGDALYDENEGGGVRYESDLVPYKPRADVVLSGKAHAPEGRPADGRNCAGLGERGPGENRRGVGQAQL